MIDVKGRRHLREKMYKQGHQVSELRSRGTTTIVTIASDMVDNSY